MDRGRKRKADQATNGDSSAKRQKVPQQDVDSVIKDGLKLIQSMKNAKDKTGRSISDLFLELPADEDVPGYYDVIKLPIAISTVEDKLNNHEYSTLTEVECDFKRMVSNAKQYNDDSSEVFADAERVRKLLHNWMKIHNPAYKDPEYVPFPTPIPGGGATPIQTNGKASETPDVDVEEEGSKPRRPTITLSKRRTSEAQPAASIEGKSRVSDDSFEGKSFGQVQEQIVEEFIEWRDEECVPRFCRSEAYAKTSQ